MLFHRRILTRVFFSFPVIIVLAAIAFLYYCYVVEFLLQFPPAVTVAPGIVFHFTVFLLIWSYFMSICTDPGSIPPNFELQSEEQIDRSTLEDKDYKSASASSCIKCGSKRPARAHHCSSCDRCILRMDHHCPWIGNCVGFSNHRFFIQFLGYGCLSCLNLCMGSLARLQESSMEESRFSLIACIAGGGLSLSLGSLFAFHVFLTVTNQTTLELDFHKDFNVFDSGSSQTNCYQVFGERFWPKVFPIKARLTVDGTRFPSKIRTSYGEPLLVKDGLVT